MWSCNPEITGAILNTYRVAGPLVTQALQALFAAQCAMVGDHLWPPDATSNVLQDPSYDFIIVGAGSAGSVVANRLSEVPHWKILLVEAGGYPTLGTMVPQLFYNNMNTEVDWSYKTEPQDACLAYKEGGCAWPRGKVLGGTSSINGMFYVRGNKLDYDEWQASGNYGWSYEDVLPYFIKSENFSSELHQIDIKYHGTGGYLNVENNLDMHDLEKLVITANAELGLQILKDVNGASQMGVTNTFTTTKEGLRHSTAKAFLNPIKDRKNLHVITNAQVNKILFESGSNVVSGISLSKDGRDINVNIKKELIISAGSINTPQLLMLSGLGPRQHLEDSNINIKADLPVGENLQDHVFCPIFFTKPVKENFNTLTDIINSFSEHILNSTGIYSSIIPHRVISFINTTDMNAISPDIQNHYLFLPPYLNNLLDFLSAHDLSDNIVEKVKEINKHNLILVSYVTLLKPKSKGRIMLKSTNPQDKPLIYSNYFESSDDLRILIKAMKIHGLKLSETKTFQEAGFQHRWLELEACQVYDKESDDYLECQIKHLTFSLYHPVGTAKMGSNHDKSAVVDPELKVNKVQRLRVIDASIMPSIVRGNTNAPTIMIAEKGANMIKKDWVHIHEEF